jgi:DNA-binding winged helix-turn-helix (wHTH) protein/tetratricopeptide (TPR) repeat protein
MTRRSLQFGAFTLDLDRLCLRGPSGQMNLRPKSFEVLRYLVEHAGRVVTKEEVINAVWPNVTVTDESLSRCVSDVRRALADQNQQIIKTVPRRGYLFDTAVSSGGGGELAPLAQLAAEALPDALEASTDATRRDVSENASVDCVAPGTLSPPAGLPAFVGERRQLTLLSCEIVVPAELSSNMDLEDLRDTIDAYHRYVAKTAARFTGVVAKRIGNGALIHFGYPTAHEDDAEQAVRAGLELCGAVESAGRHSPPVWQSRVGIATGEVIADGGTPGEILVGGALNLSRRLQVLAEPAMVVVDKTTKWLIGDLFEFRDLGAIETPGLETIRAWQVHANRAVESRFAALRSGALTPLVGREEEMALLVRRWTQAAAGEARVVLVAGEAGIGKSRIVAELEERIQSNSYVRFHYSCSPRHTDSPLNPIVVELERSAGFDRRDAPAEKLAKLSMLLERTTAPPEDVALLADLLSLSTTDGPPCLNPSSQRKKETTAEALVRHIARPARLSPVLVVFEDTHWIDPSSLDTLSLMIERLRTLPVLILVTFRPDFRPPWVGQPNVTMLSLSRLDRRENESLVRHLAVHASLPDEIITAIAERTDGVPLFTEEVTKAVLDSNAVVASPRDLPPVPATLRASLMARLDGLGAGKQIVEIGAVIGREFSYELLAIVSGRNERELASALAQVVDSGLLLRRGIPPATKFIFKHALIQDIAYSSLLRNARQQLHARIADVLQTHFGDIATDQPEILAHHFEQSGDVEHAVKYWISAGDLASRRAASREAAVHYRAALTSFERQQSASIDTLEPETCMKLGNALIQSEGYGSASAIEAYRRALTRAEALDQTEDYAKATSGLAPPLFSSCHYREVVNRIEKLLEEKQGQLRPHTRIHLHTMLGVANYCLGNFVTAWDQFEAARRIDLEWPCTSENPIGGGDPAVVIRNYMGMTGSVLGRIEKGLTLTEEGVALARKRADAFSLAWALLGRARALRAAGRYDEGMSDANEAADLCEKHGYRARLGTVLVARGSLLAGLGDGERGLQDMYMGADMWHRTSGNFHMSEWLSYLADCLWRLDRLAEAETVLRQAERIVEGTDEKSHLAEVLRLRGNLLLCNGAVECAEMCLVKATEWSREREAKVFELRARRDLARIHIRDGKVETARELLKGGISLFADDLAFPDLQESRELLQHL